MRIFFAFLLRSLGWKIVLNVEIPSKCVLCVAPHTSNWDFLIGISFYKSIGGRPYFLMKKDWFFFPLGNFLRSIGGIPVNRGKKTSLSDQMAELFDSQENFQLAIAPEGTRKKTTHWKTGFYYIALKANVPITLAYIDYEKKIVGIDKIFYPTGNLEEDMTEIKNYYKDIKGKYPEKFSI